MKEETSIWLKYADENLEAAKVLLNKKLFNNSLQNSHQSIEKYLKSVFIEHGIKLKRSHSILELKNILNLNGINIDLTDDECDLFDSLYTPSRYPIGNALPEFHPDEELTNECIKIAGKISGEAIRIIGSRKPWQSFRRHE